MSSKVAESPLLTEEPGLAPPAERGASLRGGVAAASVLAPALAALGAWAVYRYIPNRQVLPMSWMDALPAWRHPYPLVLLGSLGIALLLAVAQWAWRPLRPWARHHAPLFAAAFMVLAAWDLATTKRDWLKLPYFPGPDLVLGGMIEDRTILLESTRDSLMLLFGGYSAGVAAGLVTGLLIGWFPHIRYWIMPLMKIIGPIPATALIALVMMLFAKAYFCGIALIAFAVWFPVTMLTFSGIANVRLSYLDVARTLGAGRLYLICRVAIPAAMPNIFIGLFMGLLTSFLTLIPAETVGVQSGLGFYLKWQQGYMEYGKMYGALIIMAAFFSGIMTLLFKVRDWVLVWQKGVIRW